jgi:hypothetical protein
MDTLTAMRNPRRVLLLVLVAVAAGCAPASAAASSEAPAAILKACSQNDYALPGHYSVAALRAAYDSISAASREYSTCAQVIETKITNELRTDHITPGSGGGGGSGFPVVIVVIVVIVLVGGGGAFYSYRRSRQ